MITSDNRRILAMGSPTHCNRNSPICQTLQTKRNVVGYSSHLLKQEGNRIGLKLKMLEARAEEDVIYIKPATVRTDDLKITELLAADGLPKTGFVLLSNIIGDPKGTPPIPAIIPVSRSTWLAGVKTGLFPKPVKLSSKIRAWRVGDIRKLIREL